ncbi:MAG TPA: hypothetical protein DCE42_08480 [Myxococcales bacterium]|nr:hypothetical protein [Deltaproteobacteria bacterium]HAA54781.1 hypothetical protein [Myxococcales bacterium]
MSNTKTLAITVICSICLLASTETFAKKRMPLLSGTRKPKCVFQKKHPLPLKRIPTFRAYKGCKGSLVLHYLGTKGKLHKRPVWSKRRNTYFSKIKIPHIIGMSECNRFTAPQMKRYKGHCLRFSDNRLGWSAQKTALALLKVFKEEPDPVWFVFPRIMISKHTLKPRCYFNDPKCLPVPYTKAGALSYRPKGRRFPIRGKFKGRGRCQHDGDCVKGGCGNHCVSYKTPGFAAICPYYTALSHAYCGCVKNRCMWFNQH